MFSLIMHRMSYIVAEFGRGVGSYGEGHVLFFAQIPSRTHATNIWIFEVALIRPLLRPISAVNPGGILRLMSRLPRVEI